MDSIALTKSGTSLQRYPLIPDFITSRLPMTFETTHGFFMYIASRRLIGSPSHRDGRIKTSDLNVR